MTRWVRVLQEGFRTEGGLLAGQGRGRANRCCLRSGLVLTHLRGGVGALEDKHTHRVGSTGSSGAAFVTVNQSFMSCLMPQAKWVSIGQGQFSEEGRQPRVDEQPTLTVARRQG